MFRFNTTAISNIAQMLLFTLAAMYNMTSTAQVVYKVERGSKTQYLIPTTNYGEPGEFNISDKYIRLLSKSKIIRSHVGKGAVSTKNIRSQNTYFKHTPELMDYTLWCTNGKVDLSNPENRTVRINSLLNIEKCTVGNTPLRERKITPFSAATAENSVAAMTAKQLAQINPRIMQGEPLTAIDSWLNAAFHVDDSLATEYFHERALQWNRSKSASAVFEVEPLAQILQKGRTYTNSWLMKYGRFQHESTTGAQVASQLIGRRVDLLEKSISINFEVQPYVEQINFVPFEYFYLEFGILHRLEKNGFSVKELIFN